MPLTRRPLVVAATALAACTATALTLGTTGPAAAAEAAPRAARHSVDEPSLTGSAKLARQPGDNVHFRINAHGFADKARGTFYVSHHFGKVWGGHFKGRIDCLVTGGPVAVATGIVTESHFKGAPGLPEIGTCGASGSASPCWTAARRTGWATAGPWTACRRTASASAWAPPRSRPWRRATTRFTTGCRRARPPRTDHRPCATRGGAPACAAPGCRSARLSFGRAQLSLSRTQLSFRPGRARSRSDGRGGCAQGPAATAGRNRPRCRAAR